MPRPTQPEASPAAPDRDAAAVEAIARLAQLANRPFPTPEGGQAHVVPHDHTLEILAPVDPPLTHIEQRVDLADLESFVEYVTAFRTSAARIFATTDCPPRLEAIFDYHEDETAGRCHHIAALAPPLAEEWERWTAIDGRFLAQQEFAEFIEENAHDIRQPAAGDILDVVANLKAQRQVAFESGVSLASGAVQLVYVETIDGASAKSSLEVPATLTLGIPMFFNGAPYEVELLLRYRIAEGKLKFCIKMHRRAYIERDAITELVAVCRSRVDGVPVVFGRPVL